MIDSETFNNNKIKSFLKEMKIPFANDSAIIPLGLYEIEFPFNSNIAYLINKKCVSCPLDCYKRIQIYFNEELDEEIGKIKKFESKNKELTELEIDYLSRLLLISKEPTKYFDFEELKHILTDNLTDIFFSIVGARSVGKSTILELVPGIKSNDFKEIDTKINKTFPPLFLNIMDINHDFSKKSKIAPYLLTYLELTFMFLIVSDSTSKDALAIKNTIIENLKRINPSSLQVCIANKQDNQHILTGEAIEKITGLRTYELIATNQKFEERLMKIIYETVLLRIDQMKENHCFLFPTDFTTTSQL